MGPEGRASPRARAPGGALSARLNPMSSQRYHHTDSVIGEFLNPTDHVIEDMKARGQPPKNYYAEERKRVRQIEAQKRAEREEEERKAAAGLWKDPQFRKGQSRVMEAVEASIAEASARAAPAGERAPLPASARPGGSGPHYTQQEIERARAKGQEIREEARRAGAQRAAREERLSSRGSSGGSGRAPQPRPPRDFSYAGYKEELRQQEQASKARQERQERRAEEERQRGLKAGERPAYIEERRRQWAEEEAARRQEEERRREQARVPPGTRRVGDEERKALLAQLRDSLQAEIKRLNSFSVTTSVSSTLRAREECERKIDQIEKTIREFERPGDVYIAMD